MTIMNAPVYIAQCIAVGSGRDPLAGGGCPSGMVARCIGTVAKCVQEICGPLPESTLPQDTLDCSKQIPASDWTIGFLVAKIMGFLMPVTALIIFFIFVAAGYDYITSWGDPEKVSNAWKKITYAGVGALLLVTSYSIVRIVAAVMGFDSPF